MCAGEHLKKLIFTILMIIDMQCFLNIMNSKAYKEVKAQSNDPSYLFGGGTG